MEGTATTKAVARDESKQVQRHRVSRFVTSDDLLDFSVAHPFSDMKLVSASGHVLYAARFSLAVRSPVCKQMMLGGMKEAQSMTMADPEMVTIPFPDMRTEALQALLQFCIFGRFSEKLVREAPVDVIHAARYFHLTDEMEELIDSVVTQAFPVQEACAGVESNFELAICMPCLAETLSFALECLPTDSDAYFFELLLKRIFSREIHHLPHGKLTSQALEFLLSKTVDCYSEPWDSSVHFNFLEYSVFCYVLKWSGHRTSEDEQQVLKKLWEELEMHMDGEQGGVDPEAIYNHIKKCVAGPGTAEALESVANIARPFLPLIDFALIPPQDLKIRIWPFKVCPEEILDEALYTWACGGLYTQRDLPHEWDDEYSTYFIHDEAYPDRRVHYSDEGPVMSVFARAYSCLKDSVEHSWVVTVSEISYPCDVHGAIGIGFCSGPDSQRQREAIYSIYCKTHRDSDDYGVQDVEDRFKFGRNCTGEVVTTKEIEVRVDLNLDTGTLCFTMAQAHGKLKESAEFSLGDEWLNSPGKSIYVYPAVWFYNSSGRVSLSVRETM